MPQPKPDSDEQPTGEVAGDLTPQAQPGGPGHVGGDVVGGSKTVTQTAGGDIVGRDKITTTTGDAGPYQQLAEKFAQISRQIDTRPADPNVDRDELKDTVRRIEAEATQGERASSAKLERWLLNLGAMADDIFQVTVATLANPLYGLAKVVQLVAQKAKEQKALADRQQKP